MRHGEQISKFKSQSNVVTEIKKTGKSRYTIKNTS